MCLPPLGYRADPDEVVAFYAALAECGLPVMAYNNPEASGVDMPAALIARIYEEVDGVVAIKECSGDARRIPALLHLDGDLEVLVGGDDWALEGFAAGASGWITGVGVLAPREMRRALRRGAANDLARGARRVPSDAPRGPLRHDPQARPVLQGRAGRRRLQRRPDARAAAAAQGGRGRGARRRPGGPARARRTRESGALLRGGRLPHRGDADARHHRRRRPDPRAPRCWSASSTSRPRWTSCGCC